MKIAVLVKRVPDTASVFTIAPDGRSIVTDKLKYVMSPYDEHAVEEAIKLKESAGAEVIVVSLGPEENKEIMRTALAMGADSGVHITGPGTESMGQKDAARALAAAIKRLGVDLVLAGKQAVDDDASQVPERVAEILGLPHASVITRFELQGSAAVVDREVEGGHFTLEVPLPAVFSIQKGINTPRYPSLPNIMKAKKKPIEDKTLESLELAPASPGFVINSMALPRQQRLNKLLDGDTAAKVKELVRILKEEEKVL